MADINIGGSIGTTGTAILGRANVIIPADANYILLVSEYTNQFLKVTSGVTLTATHNVVVPVTEGTTYIVQNDTTGGQAIQVIGLSGTGVTIANGATAAVVCDGTNYLQSSGITFAGDLSGSYSSQEVVGILNNLLPPLSDGYLFWDGYAWDFVPVSGSSFMAGGDLAGSDTSQEVIGILNNLLPSLSDGYLFWDGSAWDFVSVSSSFTAGGDLSGDSTSQEVVGILNNPLPSLSDGYLFWDGSTWDFVPISASSATALPITFQPGGTAESNVFITEASLNTAVSSAFGPQTVYLDFTDNGGTYTAAGNLDLGTFVIGVNASTSSLTTAFQIISNNQVEFKDVSLTSSAGPTLTSSTLFVRLTGEAYAASSDGSFVWTPMANSTLELYDNSTLGDGTHAAIDVVTITLTLNLHDDATLAVGALTISGGGTVNIHVYSNAVKLDASYLTLSGATVTYHTDAFVPGTTNEFTGTGTLTDIVSTETVIASNTSKPVKSSVCTVTTTDATPTLIASFTPAANTVVDWSLSFVAVNTGYGGDFYRADMTFTTVTTPALTMYPATPSAINIRTALGGFNYSVSAAIAGSAVQISVTGVAATTIDWSCILQIQVVV